MAGYKTIKKQQRSTAFVVTYILTSFIVQGSINGIYPAIGALQHQFSDIPQNMVIMLTTMPTLTSVPSMFAVGWLIKKLNIKKTMILGFIVFFIGGLGPLVASGSYWWILICRIVFGLGYGIGYSISPTLVEAYFPGNEKFQNRMIGLGTTVRCAGGTMMFSLFAAFLCNISTGLVWWVHILMVPTFLFACFSRDPEKTFEEADKRAEIEEAMEAEEAAKEEAAGEKHHIGPIGWGITALLSFTTVGFYPLFIYSALFLDHYNLGQTTTASFLSSFASIVGAVASLVIGDLYNKIGNWTIPIGLGSLAIGSLLMITATDSLPMNFVCAFFISLGFWWSFSAVYMLVPRIVHRSVVPTLNGVISGSINALAFFSAYIFTGLNTIFGTPGSLLHPYIYAGIYFVIVSVGGFVVCARSRAKAKNNTPSAEAEA